jgi:hypothetical protein
LPWTVPWCASRDHQLGEACSREVIEEVTGGPHLFPPFFADLAYNLGNHAQKISTWRIFKEWKIFPLIFFRQRIANSVF